MQQHGAQEDEMDGEPLEDEFDTSIPVDEGDAETDEEREGDAGALSGVLYDEPRDDAGPDVRDDAQDE